MIHCEGLVKIYRASGVEVFALQGLDLDVAPGEMVAVIGNSGSGKSTLLKILGGLDAPSAGAVRVGEWDLMKLTGRQRTEYRRRVVGFVWQNSALNLTPYLTAEANVLLNMTNAGTPDRQEARRLLELVGLADRRDRLPPELSGGEQQRVALAVALAAKPPVLLADEPTGSLDATSSHQVMTLLQQVSRELSMTVLLVTHDLNMTNYATRTVRIRDGKVAAEATRGTEELAVLDSAGRVQLPQPLLAATGISRLAVVEVHGSTIVLRAPAQPEEGSES
jgi:ABC-type lipoprotein export system ATPase subunit